MFCILPSQNVSFQAFGSWSWERPPALWRHMILDASFTYFYLGESLKTSIASLALVAVLALTACGGAGSTTNSAADSNTTQEAPKVPDLTGAWKQSNPNSEKSYQQASITADKLTIEWVSDGGNTTSIY